MPEWTVLVGQQIYNWRMDRGFTQSELAKLIGTNREQISFYESGQRCPGSHILFKLSEALRCKMDDFYVHVREGVPI